MRKMLISLSEPLATWARERAEKRGLSVSELIEGLLDAERRRLEHDGAALAATEIDVQDTARAAPWGYSGACSSSTPPCCSSWRLPVLISWSCLLSCWARCSGLRSGHVRIGSLNHRGLSYAVVLAQPLVHTPTTWCARGRR